MLKNQWRTNVKMIERTGGTSLRLLLILMAAPMLIALAGCPLGGVCSQQEQRAYRLLQQCAQCEGFGGVEELEAEYPNCAALSEDLRQAYDEFCAIDEGCAPYETYLEQVLVILEFCEVACP